MECPVCDKDILWREGKYLRCPCGMMFPNREDEANRLYGEWTDEELAVLEKAMAYYCDKDHHFFKGRNIITVWTTDMHRDQMMIFKSFDDLIYFLD